MPYERPVRWGHLYEIDYRTKVDSPAWHARHPTRIKHLSSWRYLHLLADHETVSTLATRSPSSDLPLQGKIALGKLLESVRREKEADATLASIVQASGMDLRTPPPSLF